MSLPDGRDRRRTFPTPRTTRRGCTFDQGRGSRSSIVGSVDVRRGCRIPPLRSRSGTPRPRTCLADRRHTFFSSPARRGVEPSCQAGRYPPRRGLGIAGDPGLGSLSRVSFARRLSQTCSTGPLQEDTPVKGFFVRCQLTPAVGELTPALDRPRPRFRRRRPADSRWGARRRLLSMPGTALARAIRTPRS